MSGRFCHHSGVLLRLGGYLRPPTATLRIFSHIPALTTSKQPQHLKRSFSSDDSHLNLARMSLTQMPKYLTGDKAAIEEFIDQFDVSTPRFAAQMD